MTNAGDLMAAEIAEQPAVFDRIVTEGLAPIRTVARVIAAADPRFVILAARGTSDHAALYAKYLLEIVLHLPVGLASPSTMTAYGARPDLRDVLFVGVSQSGGSPDLVESLTTARACGALTLAVTNNPSSALAEAAQLQLDVMAGDERSVAATKTYTAELLTLYLLVDAWQAGHGDAAQAVPAAADALAKAEPLVREIASHYAGRDRFIVTGRGYAYPTAREAALKLMETSYVSAQAFSGADLMHGPLAMVGDGSPVLAIVPEGVAGDAMAPVLERLRDADSDLAVVGSPAAVAAAPRGIALPSGGAGVAQELSPVIEILPFQQFALHLSLARGNDPDRPRGLRKVTETW